MKLLSKEEIEVLLGIRATTAHPLDILGYGYTSEGAERFRSEKPDFFSQIAAHVRDVLSTERNFPKEIDLTNPGYKTFIRREGRLFKISRMEEIGFGTLERIDSKPLPEREAIAEYIRCEANPDYIKLSQP